MNKRTRIKKLKQELDEVRRVELHSSLERIRDLSQFVRELAEEACQDSSQETHVSLAIVKDMLSEFTAGEYPHSEKFKASRDMGWLLDTMEDIFTLLSKGDPTTLGYFTEQLGRVRNIRDIHHIYRKEVYGSQL